MDDREKRPLLFPRFLTMWDPSSPPTKPRQKTVEITTASARLPTGDYLLEGFADRCVVERKAHLTELWTNLTDSKRRINWIAELERLRSGCSKPILLLEGHPLSLSKDVRPHVKPDVCRDILIRDLDEYGIGFFMLPGETPNHRRAMADWVASTLIQASWSTRCLPTSPISTDPLSVPAP